MLSYEEVSGVQSPAEWHSLPPGGFQIGVCYQIVFLVQRHLSPSQIIQCRTYPEYTLVPNLCGIGRDLGRLLILFLKQIETEKTNV
jgi:hypothetical protein